MRLLIVSLLVPGFLLGGCASPESVLGKDPIIDMKGVDAQAYAVDLNECKAYADDVQVGRQAVTSGAIGAVVGGVVGAVAGNASTARRTAGIGGVVGGVKGAGSGLSERQQVIRNCLIGRGYRILN